MSSIKENLENITKTIPENVTLVAVSKTKPNEDILEAYKAGHRVFGENKVQEMVEKHEALPKDISWHLIGHLQKNKVKYMASFVDLIHGVDSLKTLVEIDKQAKKHDRIINCLLQVKIAKEETKFGLTINEVKEILESETFRNLSNISIKGLMGMATFTEDTSVIKEEFSVLKSYFDSLKEENENFEILSMGMSGDYQIAMEAGSSMVRVGSAIFGKRNYN
ncbi:YggS family pyridoxal phosphate-dependent enzyme [Aureivirga marina]|uniref:YggS family pyridoxal phosphate-dependent enzyme n=1 Tax=Aureivirga marina TaxID=1182451 RepID=UPI0018CA0B0F|nr:YggS family pyridoxal phosphate-dependent enzyme [Aureivirga marina]